MGGDTRVVILLTSGNRAGTCEPRMEYPSEASVVSDVTRRHRGRAYLQPPQHNGRKDPRPSTWFDATATSIGTRYSSY
jgi:hypothetical protein